MTHARHFVFAGGGSGGHLTPAIAVARQLRRVLPSCRLTFLTSGRAVDQTVMHHAHLPNDSGCQVIPLPLTQRPGLSRSGFSQTIQLWKSVRQSHRLMQQVRPDVVLASGAFASVPGLLAARRLRVPIVLFEANAVPGRVNQWWQRHARLCFCGWPDPPQTGQQLFESTGMPLAEATTGHEDIRRLPTGQSQLLIVGGSQGSRRLNELIVAALSRISLPDGWQVLHQTGSNERQLEYPAALTGRVRVQPFLADLPGHLAQSSVVVSRAGAVTLAEIAASRQASVLVPLSSSSGDHQRANAMQLAGRQAARVIDERDKSAPQDLASVLHELLHSSAAREELGRAIGSLHRPAAAEQIAKRLIDLTNGAKQPHSGYTDSI